jgi:hypothetical protein
MASVKITELSSSGPLTGSEVLPVVQGNETVKTTVQEIGSFNRPYKVYTALLTQSGGDNTNTFISSGLLTIGVTYLIDEIISGSPDFTNVGAPNNNQGTYFVATGTTPNSWGEDVTLSYTNSTPVATVLENTIGNIWFTYNNVGSYFINANNLFSSQSKSCVAHSGITSDDGGPTSYFVYASVLDSSFVRIFVNDVTGVTVNSILGNYLIEIRVYN